MSNIVFVSDIVEANGKTVRENNLEQKHKYPLGSLVEVVYQDGDPDEDNFGVRLFVVRHGRDCDGTPLYDLSYQRNAYVEFEKFERELKEDKFADQMEHYLCNLLKWQAQGRMLRNYGEDSIRLVDGT